MPSPLAISATWDAVAPDYTADLVPLFELYARDALALADLPDRARVLDVAAGPGTLALLAAPDADHVDAVDFSPAMVETLRQRAPAAGAAGTRSNAASTHRSTMTRPISRYSNAG